MRVVYSNDNIRMERVTSVNIIKSIKANEPNVLTVHHKLSGKKSSQNENSICNTKTNSITVSMFALQKNVSSSIGGC